MKNEQKKDVAVVVAEFLADTPNASALEWAAFMRKHPDIAGELVDFAILRGRTEPMGEPEADAPIAGTGHAEAASRFLSLLHDTPNPLLARVEAALDAMRGPAIRKVATDFGVGHASLMSGVLAGSIAVPRRLVRALRARLEATAPLIQEAINRFAARAPMPAHKATAAKPEVVASPRAWAEAVRQLNLGEDETRRLLAFDDEDPPA